MALTKEEIQELSQILGARAGQGRSARPPLRLITPPSPKLLDPIFREAHLKRIAHIRKAYRLDWLVEQATFSVPSVWFLEDCDLIRLLDDMERARQCMADGISFEDAGLVRAVTAQPAARLAIDRALQRQEELAAMRLDLTRPAASVPAPRCDEAPF